MKVKIERAALFFVMLVAFVLALSTPPAFGWGRGHFYVIGTGPAGPRMATLQALETIKQMDVVVAAEKHAKLFSGYIGDKPGLFDPWTGIWDYNGKKYDDLSPEEKMDFNVERFRLKHERVNKIKNLLAQGKDVGLLDSGNPCLFGPSHWYVEEFDAADVVIIPGMGCDAAAMAALGKSTIPAHDVRQVIQTYPPYYLKENFGKGLPLKGFGANPSTMIFYMALWKPKVLFRALRKALPTDMPCAVVYWAGYPDRERVVRGTIADMEKKLAREKEKFMGLLFVGRFLEGKPYEEAMKLSQE